jgi:tetratricopeptide (TPR) repeat protein
VAKTALLLRVSDAEQARVLLQHLEPLMRVLEANEDTSWRLQVRGMFKYRAGDYAEAVRLLKQSLGMFDAAIDRSEGAPTSELYLALAIHDSGGDTKMSEEAVRAALDIMDRSPMRLQKDRFHDRLVIEVALREAREELQLPGATAWPFGWPSPPSSQPADIRN